MNLEFRRITLVASVALLALLAFPLSAAAQRIPADSVLRNFQPTGDYILEVDGQEYPKAKIYRSQSAAAFLIRAGALDSPVLLSPRAGSVQTVSIMSLNMQATGTIDILANAQLIPQGRFKVDGEEVVFAVDGHSARLRPKPALTGPQKSTDMVAHSPSYATKAEAYSPDLAVVEGLRNVTSPARVKVFFGSWCPFCSNYVPRMIKVAELLQGSKIEVEYYGLPKPPFTDDPAAKAEKIDGVPTGIVYSGGREVGRIQGDQWSSPEKALQKILSGS